MAQTLLNLKKMRCTHTIFAMLILGSVQTGCGPSEKATTLSVPAIGGEAPATPPAMTTQAAEPASATQTLSTGPIEFCGRTFERDVTEIDCANYKGLILAPVKNFTSLLKLSLLNTNISDLTALKELHTLKELHLDGSTVMDLTPLAGLTVLKVLTLAYTPTTNLTPLAGLTALELLDLGGTKVTHLAPLEGLTGLNTLILTNTNVSDLAPLKALTALTWLDLNSTQVTDLAPLRGMTALKLLGLNDTQVPDAQIKKLRAALPNLIN